MGYTVQDHFFKRAKRENFLARSVYKLQEIDKKFHIFSLGDKVIDLGHYPGSWSQYASKSVGREGRVVGIDKNPPNRELVLENAIFFQKDIFSLDSLLALGYTEKIDILLSDMAPNTTGIKIVDQARCLNLVEKVFDFMEATLRVGGKCVIKVFDGQDAQNFLKEKKSDFCTLKFFRPKSTRSVSKEFFVIGLGYKSV